MAGRRAAPGVLDTSDSNRTQDGSHERVQGDDNASGRVLRLMASTQPRPAVASRDALLVPVLTLLNESTDMHATLREALDIVRMTLGCQIAEIWLSDGGTRDVALECSSTDGSGHSAFEAAGISLGKGPGPSLVGRAIRTGRGSMAAPYAIGHRGDRDAETVAAGIRCTVTFPIRGLASVVGVLVGFHVSPARPVKSCSSPSRPRAVRLGCSSTGHARRSSCTRLRWSSWHWRQPTR